jgi:hypothetical protein
MLRIPRRGILSIVWTTMMALEQRQNTVPQSPTCIVEAEPDIFYVGTRIFMPLLRLKKEPAAH